MRRLGRGFDRIARLYRWMEYLSFGRALEHCRCTFLAEMRSAERALVLGDGDGRFTAALLAANCGLLVVAVDSSPAMLELLRSRVERIGASTRLTTMEDDAVRLLAAALPLAAGNLSRETGITPGSPFDLVISHFFLDCLSSNDVERLIAGILPRLAPGALWIVSEFATPSLWTRIVVWLLYRVFALLTGLRVQQLPAYEEALEAGGFVRLEERQQGRGLLRSSLWQARPSEP